MKDWFAKLSEFSPDWYDGYEDVYGDDETPPFYISFVEAGSRVGYQWRTIHGNPCEVNWLDPEPDKGIELYYVNKVRGNAFESLPISDATRSETDKGKGIQCNPSGADRVPGSTKIPVVREGVPVYHTKP
jgi:hypothetical protein